MNFFICLICFLQTKETLAYRKDDSILFLEKRNEQKQKKGYFIFKRTLKGGNYFSFFSILLSLDANSLIYHENI